MNGCCVIFLLLFTFTLTFDDSKPARHIGRIDGEQTLVTISVQDLVDSPSWNPAAEEDPPLSVGRAIRSAKKAVVDRFPEFEKEMHLATLSVQLVQEHSSVNSGMHSTDKDGKEHIRKGGLEFVGDRWVYWVQFSWIPPVSDGPNMYTYPIVPVAVLMNGKASVARRIVDNPKTKSP
jgi:hypothetical protein